MKYNFSIIEDDCKELFSRDIKNINTFKYKSVLITGANGLIGGFLSDFMCYLNDKHNFNINIYLTSLSEKEKAQRIQHLVNRKDVTYFSWDLANEFPTEKIKNVNYVFFASGYGQPKKFIDNKINTILINTIGLNSLLKFCAKNSSSLLYMSTSEIYGSPDDNNVPTKEEYNGNYSITSNRACYISSKRLGEVLCCEYSKQYNFDIKIARIALTYGPGVLFSDDRVLQDFILNGKKNKNIILMDDGSAIRNYIYIVDSIEIMLNILLNGKSNIYNIGGDKEEVTIFDLANKIGNIYKISVNKGNKKSDNIVGAPNKVSLDMSKYQTEFNKKYDKFIKLDDGIKNVIKWFNI